MTLHERVQLLSTAEEILKSIKPELSAFFVAKEFTLAMRYIELSGLLPEKLAENSTLNIFRDDKDWQPSDVQNILIPVRNSFLNSIELLKKTLAFDEDKSRTNSVMIKFPPIVDFGDLAKVSETFQKILSLSIINETIKGEIVIDGVEEGSIWTRVYVGSMAAVTFIGSLTWSASVVYKKYNEAKYIEQLVNQQTIQNEHKKVLIDAQKEITNLLIDAEATHLYHEYFKNEDADAEQIARLKLSVKLLSEEISKGAEIVPTLATPEDVKNVFPDMKNLPSIESKIKKIENKKD